MKLELKKQSIDIQGLKLGDVIILDGCKSPVMIIRTNGSYRLLNLETFKTVTGGYDDIQKLMNSFYYKPKEIIKSESLTLKQI